MIEKTDTVDEYIAGASGDHVVTLTKLREIISQNLPEGFEETIVNNMIAYVVPHETYPPGNHENPEEPLPFISLGVQSKHVTLYHKGLQFVPGFLQWFLKELDKIEIGKPGLGQNSIKFTPESGIPGELVGSLCRKIYPDEWIEIYEENMKK